MKWLVQLNMTLFYTIFSKFDDCQDRERKPRADRQTDRQMDGKTLKPKFFNKGYNIIPPTFKNRFSYDVAHIFVFLVELYMFTFIIQERSPASASFSTMLSSLSSINDSELFIPLSF